MGTKLTELQNGCFHAALNDEPLFVLLARDPSAPKLVEQWAYARRAEIDAGARPATDMVKVTDAIDTAMQMRLWRNRNNGAWRKGEPSDAGKVTVCGKQILRGGVELAQCANPDIAQRIVDALNNDENDALDLSGDDQAMLDLSYDDKPATCAARRVGDQMQCGKCGLQWDFNDPDAPSCRG